MSMKSSLQPLNPNYKSVHIKAISLMAVILRLELWNIQETSRNFLVIENPCGQRVIAEHATPTYFSLIHLIYRRY